MPDPPEPLDLRATLDKQWRWLERNPGHPQFRRNEDRFLAKLAEYEDACRALWAPVQGRLLG